MSGKEPTWVDIGPLEAVPILGARVIKTATGCIAVFRTAANEAFALDDRCPHKGGPLSQGIVHGKAVTCPLHNWVIDLETGEAQGADSGKVKTIATKIEAGRILLDTSTLTARHAA